MTAMRLILSFIFLVSFVLAQSTPDQGVLDEKIVDSLNSLLANENLSRMRSEKEGEGLKKLYGALSALSEKVSPMLNILDRKYDYFTFLPVPVSSVLPSQQGTKTFSTDCFQSNVISDVTISERGEVEFTMTVSDPVSSSSSCKDFYLFSTLSSVQFHYLEEGTHKFHWRTASLTAAELWDVNANGIRMFRFLSTPTAFIASLVQTALLFEPTAVGPAVNSEFGRMNVHFLKNYPQFDYPERPEKTRNVNINASDIQSGDFVGIIRMDGLDPMISFGMGGTTGHTTVALRFDGELYITESQVKSAYWPTNNIQRTPWATWVKQAHAADYNFVHVPLSQQMRSSFNETAAQQFFYEMEGTPYGYHNFLFGWLDTATQNFPCLPPDYESCLTADLVMVASGLVDRIDPAIADKMWNQAFVHRLNLKWGTLNTTAQVYQYSYQQKSLTFEDLIQIPEQDSWVYTDGKSMVCDVYVCGVWKSAGLFGDLADKIQCAELTPADIYKLNFFEKNAVRPKACIEADPDLPYCQLGGKYRLNLFDYNTVEPYAMMDQTCPGVPPKFNRPTGC